jgi:hypothetical protein
MQWCSLLIHTGFELMLHCRWSSWFDPCQPGFQMVVLLPFESYKICRLQVIRFLAGVVLQILIWCLDLYWRYIQIQKQKNWLLGLLPRCPALSTPPSYSFLVASLLLVGTIWLRDFTCCCFKLSSFEIDLSTHYLWLPFSANMMVLVSLSYDYCYCFQHYVAKHKFNFSWYFRRFFEYWSY